jgi:hypothetical protein
MEVKDVAFPKRLDPIDDLPPMTVITHPQVGQDSGGFVARLRITGRSSRCW